MKHRKVSRLEALARVSTMPRVEVAATACESPRAKFDREEREEAARQDEIRMQPVRQAEQQLNATMQQLRSQHAQSLLSGTSPEFLSYTTSITDDDVIVGGKPIEIPVVRQRIQNAFHAVVLKLEDEGVRFTNEGRQRLQSIARLEQYRGVNWMSSANWLALFQYADEVGLMTERECSRAQVAQPVAQEPSESFDDVIATANGETRDGQRALRIAAMFSYQQETYTWFLAWQKSVIENLNWSPTEQDIKNIIDFMRDHNLSPVSAKSWDAARIACCKSGLLSNNRAMYPDEKFAAIISDDSTDTRSFNGRTALRHIESQIKRSTL